ncbi:trichohyalin isoform X1 [Monomorium pharaonis]|uniref:trichohyalin isoform X1 n=2 Tax=Monomorium pharaonis TaxID=307658 RepID=UPI001747C168|nr:trichohyalin isoform X1 [Monomorium pharaonis]
MVENENREEEGLGGLKNKGDVAKKKGRPTNLERLTRERTRSMNSIEEMLIRGKRKEREQDEEGMEIMEEEEILKRSRIGKGSPETNECRGGNLGKILEELGKLGKKMDEGKEELKKQIADLKNRWEEERREMRDRIELMEKRIEDLEEKLEKEGDKRREILKEEGRKEGKEGAGEITRRMREVEVRLDKRERESRRNNIIVKGIKIGEGKVEETIKELWGEMGIEESLREVRRVGGVDREGRGMMLVKLGSLESKRRVMEAKKRLKGRRERIDDDLTREERRARWKIEREADKEREKGKRVNVGYMRMWVDGKVKIWDEIGEMWFGDKVNE